MCVTLSGLSEAQARAAVQVGEADFDLSTEVQALRAGLTDVGAVASFVGTVRDWVDLDEPDGHGPRTLWLEHHPAMTPLALEQLVQVAHARFDVQATRLIHRVGSLAPGDQIVLVAVASAHRGEAFAACMFLMDALKTQAPFWKKECVGETGQWVAACDSDDAAWLRWT